MATIARRMATPSRLIGPSDQGRRMSLEQFMDAEFEEGWLYELARGMVTVTEVPGIPHGRIVNRLIRLAVLYDERRPGVINYYATGTNSRLRLPGMQSDRHPDLALY